MRIFSGAQACVGAHWSEPRWIRCQETYLKLGHHRSNVNVRTGKTGTDSARTGKTGTGAGKGRATARVKPRLSPPLPRTRDGHAATYSAMREHACYNCTTCHTQVKSGGLTRVRSTPPAKAHRLVLSTAELARSPRGFVPVAHSVDSNSARRAEEFKRRKAKESL